MEKNGTNTHINEYISGELTGNDLIEFEKLLAKDEALQQKIKVHQQIDQVLSENYFEVNRFNKAAYENEQERLSPILKKMNQKYFVEEDIVESQEISNKEPEIKSNPKNIPIIRKLLPFVSLAAAAALLLFLFNPFANNLSPTQLADQYYESYIAGTIRGEDQISDTPDSKLAKGSEQFEANEIDEAIQTFKQVAANSSLIYKNEANWYLALCYLKQNKSELAKPLLKQLQQTADYAEKAKAILKQLE